MAGTVDTRELAQTAGLLAAVALNATRDGLERTKAGTVLVGEICETALFAFTLEAEGFQVTIIEDVTKVFAKVLHVIDVPRLTPAGAVELRAAVPCGRHAGMASMQGLHHVA